jgi:hypothetical protein
MLGDAVSHAAPSCVLGAQLDPGTYFAGMLHYVGGLGRQSFPAFRAIDCSKPRYTSTLKIAFRPQVLITR